jgi:phosphomannomutase
MKTKTALILDIDNTLTPPRQPLTERMAHILDQLLVPFHVAAGSHLELLRGQFFEPLYAYGFRKQFEAFISLGGVHYRCDYSRGMGLEVVSTFDIREHLGEEDYGRLVRVLEETLAHPDFRLPGDVRVIGETITCRGSMVNLCPVGRARGESEEYRRNREWFVGFDEAEGYRQRMMARLLAELAPLVEKRGLRIVLGGQTSFDISVEGRDKTYAVRRLLEDGYDSLVFIGDALFEGGNDAPIREFVESWGGEGPCPVEAVQVNSMHDTVRVMAERGFISPGAAGGEEELKLKN